MPTPEEMVELSRICEQPVMQLISKNKDFGQTDLKEIMMSNSRNSYNSTDIANAADLIQLCLKWVPR